MVIVGDVANTAPPVPVTEPKSVKPNSQSAAVVNVVPIQVTIAVVCGITVQTRFPPEELTVRFPVELLTMWSVHPVMIEDVTGSVIVCANVPVNS